jgi:uncharacterized protein (DUF3820 family)
MTPVVYDTMPIGKYKGWAIADVPYGWARYMREHASDLRPDLDRTITYIMKER